MTAPPTPLVTIVGLGPAGPERTAEAAADAMRRAPVCRLRTGRHPAAEAWVAAGVPTFDPVYESAQDRAEVYREIVERLVADARSYGALTYAVPGSPFVGEDTVAALRKDPRVVTQIIGATGFLDLAWERLGIDPVAASVRVVDAERFAAEAAGERGPFLVAQAWSREVLSQVKLAAETPPGTAVTVLHHLGLDDERVVEVPWDELDRAVAPDHLTSLYVPALGARIAPELVELDELVRTLRARCPWDREQTHASLARHLLEEAYEALDAIGALGGGEDPERVAHLAEELGDVLVQVVFHARLAAEKGWFTLADVAAAEREKLVGRHPHVFAGARIETAEGVAEMWEVRKVAEKGRESIVDGIPAALPALALAAKLQRKAASLGLDPSSGSGSAAGGTAAGIGEELWRVVDRARRSGVEAEEALRAVANRYRDELAALAPTGTPSTT